MRYLYLLIALLLFSSVQAEAQSASDIIHQMVERQQQQYQNIEDYTLVTNRYTSYYKRNPDGITFKSRTDWSGGGLMQGQRFGAQAYQHDPSQLENIATHAEYLRQETLEGRSAHVLRIDGTSFMEAFAEENHDTQGTVGDVYFYVDAERYLPLRIEYKVVVDEYDGREISPSVNFSDYQQVDGLWIPYRTEMRMEDLDAAITPEERAELATNLEDMERQMREAGGLQRRIVERALGGQMKRLRERLAEGILSYSIEVEDVVVNSGLADDLFGTEGDEG